MVWAAHYEQKINYDWPEPNISSKKSKNESCNSSDTVCTNRNCLQI